jgi:hypothetical protein
MKSVLSDKCCEKKEKPFPKLMWKPARGSIWLMTSEGVGTAVYGKDSDTYRIGEHVSCLMMNFLEDYEGDVCLTNS